MANEKNKSNELVSDEDPTSELEAVTFRQDHPSRDYLPRESDEHTHDFSDDSSEDARTVTKLQYDIEQLRAKWLGVETELKVREDLTTRLNTELDGTRETLARKEKLLKSRDRKIKALKAEIRQRDEHHRTTTRELRDEVEAARKAVREIPEPPQADGDAANDGDRLARTEEYADLLRRKMQDILELQEELEKDRDWLESACNDAYQRNRGLVLDLAEVRETQAGLEEQLATINETHAEEIRMLRFELGQAQDTVAQTEELNSQLASDLIDTREFKEELERMLSDTDEKSRQRIDELERELAREMRRAKQMEEKLEARSDAVNVLLSELARKSERIQSIDAVVEEISDIEGRGADHFEEESDDAAPRHNDRVTRVLVGKVGDKLLRFPLFKDRLTIGRSDDNDIQLNAAYISRRHAVVQTDGDTTRLIDWGSKNGVYVNSARVTEHFLRNGDIVSIGNAHFRYDERPKRDV